MAMAAAIKKRAYTNFIAYNKKIVRYDCEVVHVVATGSVLK